MKKKIDIKRIALFVIIMISFSVKAQITLIPDSAFEGILVSLDIDSDGEVNGQILTSDAESVTTLDLFGYVGIIHDFTGIEDFVNLEYFSAGYSELTNTHLDLSALVNLKTILINNCGFTSIDFPVSENLEEVTVAMVMDLESPVMVNTLDFSNSPKVNFVDAYNLNHLELDKIIMRNNTADSVYMRFYGDYQAPFNICIEVDDIEAAENQLPPYDTWEIDWDVYETAQGNYFFSENCTLSTERFVEHNFSISPNPASDYVSVQQKELDVVQLRAVQILDSSGKWI